MNSTPEIDPVPVAEPRTPQGALVGETVIRANLNEPIPVDKDSTLPGQDVASLVERMTAPMVPQSGVFNAMYPSYSDEGKRSEALNILITKGLTIEEVAHEINVPVRTVEIWAYSGDWATLMKCGAQARREIEKVYLSNLRTAKRIPILKEQFESAHKLRDAGKEMLENAETARDNEVAAGMLKAASDIEVRALGIGESGAVTEDSAKKSDADSKEGKQPLVVVFNGGLPPIHRSRS